MQDAFSGDYKLRKLIKSPPAVIASNHRYGKWGQDMAVAQVLEDVLLLLLSAGAECGVLAGVLGGVCPGCTRPVKNHEQSRQIVAHPNVLLRTGGDVDGRVHVCGLADVEHVSCGRCALTGHGRIGEHRHMERRVV